VEDRKIQGFDVNLITRGLQCGETSSPDDHPMDPDEAWKTAGLLRRELFGFPVPTPRDLPTPTYDWD
jgi:hypothetical protein